MMIAGTDSQTRKVRRCQNGSIDMAYYLPRGRRLRGLVLRRFIKWCIARIQNGRGRRGMTVVMSEKSVSRQGIPAHVVFRH